MDFKTDFVTKGNNPKIIFIVIVLFSIHFWDLTIFPHKVNLESLVTWSVCGYCFIMEFTNKTLKFRNAIVLMFIGIFINMLQAHVTLGQNIKDSIFAFAYFYFILIYFLLHYLKLSVKFLENVVIAFGVIFSIIYFIQILIYPTQIVSLGLNLDRGSYQFEIIGHGFLMLSYFLLLNRYITSGKLKNMLLAVVFFYVLFLGGFRTFLVVAILISAYMFVRYSRFSLKNFGMFILAITLFLALFQIPGFTKKIEDFVSETQKQLQQGNKIDRIEYLDFFMHKYPKSSSYFIFGGGLPGGDNINRFYNTGVFTNNENIVYVDIGLIGFYIVIGAIALAGLLWYSLKAVFIKLPRDKIYLNCYFMYLILGSFTTYEIYRPGIFTVEAIVLYLIDMSFNEQSIPEDKFKSTETQLSSLADNMSLNQEI